MKDEQYTSGVLGVPLKVLQKVLRTRVASRSQTGTSANAPSSSSSCEKETVFSCAIGVSSKTRFTSLRSQYQILDDFNPRLAVRGEWCCERRFEQVFTRLTFWGDLGCLLMPLSKSYLLGQVQEFVNLTPMHEGSSSLCRFCGRKYLREIVLLLWTSSFIVTSLPKLVNLWAFINSQVAVQIVD